MIHLRIRSKARYIFMFSASLLKYMASSETRAEYSPVGDRLSLWRKIDMMVKTCRKEHPCLHVITQDGQPVVSKEEYVRGIAHAFNCPVEKRMSAPCGIRLRGHGTAEQGRLKPYRIRFHRRTSLLGLHQGGKYRSWVLLRTDWRLCPDYLAFKLFKVISEEKYYCSDSLFVNFYLNQTSLGIYLLCEQNQAGRGRMEVYEPKKREGQPEIGYLLELDLYACDEHPYFTIEQKPPVRDIEDNCRILPARDYSVKSKIRSKAQLDFIRDYLSGVFEILYQASVHDRAMALDAQNNLVPAGEQCDSPFEAVNAVIDLESMANMVILKELVQDYDVGVGGLYLAVDFSAHSLYQRLTFVGPWDFSWAYQEDPDRNYYACTFQKPIKDMDRSNGWFILAMRLTGFQEIVKEKWRKLREGNMLEAAMAQVAADCENLRNDLAGSTRRLADSESLTDFVRRRIRWLDYQWM